MGYTHGSKWCEEKVCNEIMKIVSRLGTNTMPTHSEIANLMGDKRLVNALVDYGGTKYFANKLGLNIKQCESEFGNAFEQRCALEIKDRFRCDVKMMKPRYPYDLLVDGTVKIDVKAARLYTSKVNTKYYTFNLEKNNPTCDIFVCYCLHEDLNILKTLVIPSCTVTGKSQLSIGFSSTYDKYKDAWDFIEKYAKFYQSVVETG